jgi:hypothetical protein
MHWQSGNYIGDVTALHHVELGNAQQLLPYLLAGAQQPTPHET